MHTYCRWRTHSARGVRTPPTVCLHSPTLPTVSLHLLTLTHGNRRMEMVRRDGDAWRRRVYAHRTSRRNACTTRRSAYTQRKCVYVGSLLRYFNVAVIPGFPNARICGRLPRFGTLVPGAAGRSPCGLGTFPALQILRSATADAPQVALSESSRTCRARGCTL